MRCREFPATRRSRIELIFRNSLRYANTLRLGRIRPLYCLAIGFLPLGFGCRPGRFLFLLSPLGLGSCRTGIAAATTDIAAAIADRILDKTAFLKSDRL